MSLASQHLSKYLASKENQALTNFKNIKLP